MNPSNGQITHSLRRGGALNARPPPPESHATAESKVFCFFFQKRRPFFLSPQQDQTDKMTYGIDQCRRCGKPMEPAGPAQSARYQLSLTQKPTMSEEKWRAQGWKQAPTRFQLHHKLDGMCWQCRWVWMNQPMRRWKLLIWLMPILVISFAVIYVVVAMNR